MARNPYTAFSAEVLRIEDLGPSFRRITFGGPGMAGFGIPFHPLDLRVKLVIPPGGGEPVFDLVGFLDEHSGDGISWYQAWLQVDPSQRGSMRTYSVREWRDAERELVIDLVLHVDENGQSGPAAQWAMNARIGSHLHIMGPSRPEEGEVIDPATARGGIEFDPGTAQDILLVGDETALPAIASILEHLADEQTEDSARGGRALVEVPTAADIQQLRAPEGFDILWLPREGAAIGSLLEPAVRQAVAEDPLAASDARTQAAAFEEDESGDAVLWDVPQRLSQSARTSGSEVEEGERPFYAWIAGEAGVVTSLRRHLVREVGVDRRQVAFMGYWKLGRAEGA